MKEFIREMTRGIKLNTNYISQVRKSRETLEYMKSLDFESMPAEIKEMNLSIVERAKKIVEENNANILESVEEYEGDDCVEFAGSFPLLNEMLELYKDIKCLNSIIEPGATGLTAGVKADIEDLKDERTSELDKLRDELKNHIERTVAKEIFPSAQNNDDEQPEKTDTKRPPQRSFTVKKSSLSPMEIKDIIQDYIRINEAIFNKIIFESKQPTLSVADRILDIYFKLGTGYVINFISEPDTNYGKFYKNLLNVFSEIKDYVFDKYDTVVVPEDGKSISYLNSFYQNYIFVREKIDTALTQFKLQNSLLNENFSVKYMIFEKISGKYLVFFNGNKDLSRAVEQYFVNQAKLGTMQFEIEFVEYDGDIKKTILDRLNKIKNKIDLCETGNYMKIKRIADEENRDSLLFDVTGVKILIDPEKEYEGNDIDIVVMTNARNSHTDLIPRIMNQNPSAKLFTSDISFKIAKIKWLKELNNPNLIPGAGSGVDFTRKDIENLNERVIRITPMGKGYNYKNLVNIKFFSSGAVPGSSVVEIRDSGHKTVYLGIHTKDDTSLLKGSDNDMAEYDFIYSSSKFSFPYRPLEISLIKDKLLEGKQVFIFSDSLGNLQHAVTDLYSSGITKSMVSGDVSFDMINREILKLLSFGSSWGDNFIDRELFAKSVSKLEPFTDEYEFYKKFSTSESLVFILPFDKMEMEMVIKNKLYTENLIFVPADYEKEFIEIIEKDPMIPDEFKTGKHIVYNYIRNTGPEEVFAACKDNKQFKKLICETQTAGIPANKIIVADRDSEKKVY